MENFNAERSPNEESRDAVPHEVLAANDEFFSHEALALRGIGDDFIRQRFALEAVRRKMEEDPNSLFINSLKFTEEDIAVECERLKKHLEELGPKNALDTEKYFRTVDELIARIGERRKNR